MEPRPAHPLGRPAALVALAALGAIATGAAFAAWGRQGAGIFLALVENGLSWCF